MIILIVILAVIWALGFTIGGAVMCSNNNSVGLVLCFLGSALIGLIIGLICLHHSSEATRDERQEKLMVYETAQKQNDRQIIKDLLKQNQELIQAIKEKEDKNLEPEE